MYEGYFVDQILRSGHQSDGCLQAANVCSERNMFRLGLLFRCFMITPELWSGGSRQNPGMVFR